VHECLVFGVPTKDLDRTELIVACVVAPGLDGPEPLRQHLLHQLPSWQVPRDWWFVPALESNQRGKVSRWEWRRRYQSKK
jgi:acyl-CoA synthetase (AMP-forming)/AMP-acid ligase II